MKRWLAYCTFSENPPRLVGKKQINLSHILIRDFPALTCTSCKPDEVRKWGRASKQGVPHHSGIVYSENPVISREGGLQLRAAARLMSEFTNSPVCRRFQRPHYVWNRSKMSGSTKSILQVALTLWGTENVKEKLLTFKLISLLCAWNDSEACLLEVKESESQRMSSFIGSQGQTKLCV